MIEINITKEMLIKAKNRINGNFNYGNSFTKGKGTIYGILGEILLSNYLEIPFKNTFNYDFIYKDKRIEVKSKKSKVKPDLNFYECSIPKKSMFQKTDIYVFVCILNDLTQGYLLGWIGKKEFYFLSTFFKKGESRGKNNFIFWVDTYNIFADDLNRMDSLK